MTPSLRHNSSWKSQWQLIVFLLAIMGSAVSASDALGEDPTRLLQSLSGGVAVPALMITDQLARVGVPDNDVNPRVVVPQSEEPVPLPVSLPALSRAWEWVMEQRHHDWGWGEDTVHTVLALSLANHTWFNSENLEALIIGKQLQLELVLRMWKHKEMPLTSGHLAVSVMALTSLCRDPRAFYSKDLVAMLVHEQGVVDFTVAFSQLATCTAGRHVRKSRIRRFLDIVTDHQKIHAVDTMAVTILALQCAQRQRRHDLRHYIDQAVKRLLSHQGQDGAFSGNLHSTALALQAMMASHLAGSWNATRAQEYVMSHQRGDGSFGGLFDTNAVLPLLGGRTLLDVGQHHCSKQRQQQLPQVDPQDAPVDKILASEMPAVPKQTPMRPDMSNATSGDGRITMTYVIWIGNNATINYNRTLHVPVNTTFLTIMKKAAEEDDRFEFSASHWGNGYYVHTLGGQKEQNVGYWFWLLYRFKPSDPKPVPGTKPDNKFVVGTGVQESIPQDGEIWLFYYHKI